MGGRYAFTFGIAKVISGSEIIKIAFALVRCAFSQGVATITPFIFSRAGAFDVRLGGFVATCHYCL